MFRKLIFYLLLLFAKLYYNSYISPPVGVPFSNLGEGVVFSALGQTRRRRPTGGLMASEDKEGTPAAAKIHSHMLHDEPRLFMMHFWAVGDPGKLATGLKAALVRQIQKDKKVGFSNPPVPLIKN